ncbi:MAG: 50S ribosomal protein L11 methyltransferase [Clostridiales bacterium]|nr:50S ribosomal protein L11 methyltransferase [Clostridiales bacterium]
MVKTHTKNNMNNFIELTISTTHIGGDIISDLLWQYSDSGVVISDIEDVIALAKDGRAWDYADSSIFSADKTVLVKAYFPKESASETIKQVEQRLIQMKKDSPLDLGSLETVKRDIDGDLWREQWKEHFKPIKIGKIVIVPEWIEYKKQDDEIVVLLDSNMAFGTGEHETTSMCVGFLEKYVNKSDIVLDVGCGSGILGISASKLGANEVIMTDIDECAIIATEHNMKLNNITNGKVMLKNLLDDTTVKGNVIVCNIMAEVLIAFSPYIANNLLDNGIIILSGILVERLDAVKSAYLSAGFEMLEQSIKGEWSALALRKGDK